MNTTKKLELRNIYSEKKENTNFTDNITVDFFPENKGIMIIKSCTWVNQNMQKNNECDIMQFNKVQAIEIAYSILKAMGTLTDKTTIGNLEKSGVLPTCY